MEEDTPVIYTVYVVISSSVTKIKKICELEFFDQYHQYKNITKYTFKRETPFPIEEN